MGVLTNKITDPAGPVDMEGPMYGHVLAHA